MVEKYQNFDQIGRFPYYIRSVVYFSDMESAEGILTVMKDAGVEPSSETYAFLICGFIQQGNFERVEELIRLCETKDIALSNNDYFDMIYACAIHGHENEIDKVGCSSISYDRFHFVDSNTDSNFPVAEQNEKNRELQSRRV